MARIEKHEMAVWAVKFVGEDNILTGECYHYRFAINLNRQLARTRRYTYTPSTWPQEDRRCFRSIAVTARWCEE